MSPNIRNAETLRLELAELYARLMKDPKELLRCHEATNTAGKMIASAKVQLEAYKMAGIKPTYVNMSFLISQAAQDGEDQ